jgi:predicted SAM-dependent methyltransferase
MFTSLLKNLLQGRRQKSAGLTGASGAAPIRLHIGGQAAHPDWKILNIQPGPHVDYVGHCADLSRFADNSILEIYASHVIEHLGFRTELPAALREFNRVLAPGGRLRASVPDLDTLCRLFLDPEFSAIQRMHIMGMMFGSQMDAADFHYVGLNEEILTAHLRDAGFIDIVRVDGFGLFDDTSNMVYKKPVSLNIAARKSPAE